MDPDSYLFKHLPSQVNQQQQQQPSNVQVLAVPTTSNRFNISPNPPNPSVKLEPRETSPPTANYNIFPGPSNQNTNNYRVQQSTPSPQLYSQAGAAGYTSNNFGTNTFEQQNINYNQNNCQANYQNFDQQQNWNLYPDTTLYVNQNQLQFNLQTQPQPTNFNYQFTNLYNNHQYMTQDSINIPENLSELIDPKINVTELSGATLQKEFRSNIEVDQENMTDSFGKMLN